MDFIPLARPDITPEDIAAAEKVLLSGMLVQGLNVEKLEKNISEFTGCKHTVAVSNGTATMHLALTVLEIGKGDEVIVPAFSYVATANVVELVGAKPVFIDIEPDTFNINASEIEKHITKNTKAIIAVHEFGMACDIEKIASIAKNYNIYLIEDAACALGAMQNGKYVGTFGDFGSFSLHPRKAISSGEGGLVTTRNSDFAKRVKILRNHGIDMVDEKIEFVAAGFNYRLTDFQAALVNNQLKRLEQIIAFKQKLALVYFDQVKNKKITLPFISHGMNHTWQSFHIMLDESIDRDKTIGLLKEKNIGTNYGAQCIPFQKYYRDKYAIDCLKNFPVAMKAYTKGLAIPIYERLTEDNISYIASQLNTL
ncbi:MAG TPA: DegT/DnrJ/EryC1/StrS aminotransferase family protein [Flavobacteriales bacterium]|nr:DegT/DnrJ/EryC1/StrS aminotransferase family protein [Flavobacteriales bacterium]